ncbi:hypothetical protein AVEN_220787-1 [Araneus ventricosus]|uniref:Uncharacterized protein n=1 Tax=Araneus ventricosus TaxID=182803 RepID=A0A4Y2WUM0_ARAVE|nr:hypothetical protein AVEN_220787-1 [Araneus ventricosus]
MATKEQPVTCFFCAGSSDFRSSYAGSNLLLSLHTEPLGRDLRDKQPSLNVMTHSTRFRLFPGLVYLLSKTPIRHNIRNSHRCLFLLPLSHFSLLHSNKLSLELWFQWKTRNFSMANEIKIEENRKIFHKE